MHGPPAMLSLHSTLTLKRATRRRYHNIIFEVLPTIVTPSRVPYEMGTLVALRKFVVLAIRPAIYSLICCYLILINRLSGYGWDRPAVKVALLVAPALLGLAWQATVAINVPEPYLVSTPTSPSSLRAHR